LGENQSQNQKTYYLETPLVPSTTHGLTSTIDKTDYPIRNRLKRPKSFDDRQYAESKDITIGNRLDWLNEEIESLNSIVNDGEELDEKLNAIALMVNKARLYTALSNVVAAT
tara:strand:+ start:35 stop:370 length:336 start_codon:yes stop_codon:yes gene_type:complete